MNVKVECYAGHRGEAEPRAFVIGHRRVAVVEILDRWLSPDHRYFKLRANDGGSYILRHDERTDAWALTLFQA